MMHHANLHILGALLRKEVMLMRRNPFIPKIIFIMPIMVMLIMPLVATLDVRNVAVTVVDNDRSQLSRRLIADMDATAELTIQSVVSTTSEAMDNIEHGRADVMLSIPRSWSATPGARLSIDANGVNATKGMLGARYVAGSVANTLAQSSPAPLPSAQDMQSVDYRYNPTLNFRNYMIPALIIVLLIIICGFLPALNLVGEKESGTIEAINVTPVGRFTFVLSKLIPFWLVGIFVITVGMLIGYLVYGLAPLGSIAAIYAAAIIFSLFMSGLAVAIANSSESMLQCIFIMFACIMIFQLMGGLFTPISSMPEWAQTITYLIPPRYFNEIIRALYLKGSTIAELWVPFCGLSLAALLTCSLAALTYRKRY